MRQDPGPDQGPEPRRRRPGPWLRLLLQLFDGIKDDLFLIVAATLAAVVRAMGRKVRTGHTGLRFTCGRAGTVLHDGFHPLIPFLQTIRIVPTRSRTLDLPSQRVFTHEGLVYHVDANLVYRITDVRKALIQIDDLERGMLQMLGIGVQEVLRTSDHDALRVSDELDGRLAENLARRLEPWGVTIEHAGFPSLNPSPQTLRITQLPERTGERRQTYRFLRAAGAPPRQALALIGPRTMPRIRARALQRFERRRRRASRLKAVLVKRGWAKAEIKQAEHTLLRRLPGLGARRRRVVSR